VSLRIISKISRICDDWWLYVMYLYIYRLVTIIVPTDMVVKIMIGTVVPITPLTPTHSGTQFLDNL